MSHPFAIQKSTYGDVVVLDIMGDLTLGDPEQMFRGIVSDLVSRGQTQVLTNLQKVDFIDSSGVGALVHTHTTMTRNGGHFKLLKPGKRVRATLKLTGLEGVLEIWDDEEKALASF